VRSGGERRETQALGLRDFIARESPLRSRAGLGSIYGSYDMLYMLAQYWPLRIAQHDDRDCVNLQILLVPDILSGVINT